MKDALIQAGFVDNKYLHVYCMLMQRGLLDATDGCYTERHHIIPRCLGGSNAKQNITTLSFREHCIAHRLLIRITVGQAKSKMWHALNMMLGKSKNHKNRSLTSREAQQIKQDLQLNRPTLPIEQREKMAKSAIARWANVSPEDKYRALLPANSPDSRNRAKASLRETLQNPEIRDARSKRRREYLADQRNRQALARQTAESWNDPATRSARCLKIAAATQQPTFINAQKRRWDEYWEQRGGKPIVHDQKMECNLCGKKIKMFTRHMQLHHSNTEELDGSN